MQGSRGRMWRPKASVWSGIPLGSGGGISFICWVHGIYKLDLYRYGTRLASSGEDQCVQRFEGGNTQAQAYLL